MRVVGIPRAQIGAIVDFMRIRDMEKARLGTRVAQLSKEELETDIMSQYVGGKPLTPGERQSQSKLGELTEMIKKEGRAYTGP